MPCQLVLDSRFPHQLRCPQPSGKSRRFNSNYLHRTIQLLARCTWTPNIVNGMDQLLDWSPDADFVYMYLTAVRGVLQGKDPNEMYRDFASKRALLLSRLVQRAGSDPLSYGEALVLMGAVSLEPGQESTLTPQEVQNLMADRKYLQTLDNQREIILEK